MLSPIPCWWPENAEATEMVPSFASTTQFNHKANIKHQRSKNQIDTARAYSHHKIADNITYGTSKHQPTEESSSQNNTKLEAHCFYYKSQNYSNLCLIKGWSICWWWWWYITKTVAFCHMSYVIDNEYTYIHIHTWNLHVKLNESKIFQNRRKFQDSRSGNWMLNWWNPKSRRSNKSKVRIGCKQRDYKIRWKLETIRSRSTLPLASSMTLRSWEMIRRTV